MITLLSKTFLKFNFYFYKKQVLNSNKFTGAAPLYVADEGFSKERVLRHFLWKLVSETALDRINNLTEIEVIMLNKLVTSRYTSGSTIVSAMQESELKILQSAIDKIIWHINTMNEKGNKYDSLYAKKSSIIKGLPSFIPFSEKPGTKANSLPGDKDSLNADMGLSARTIRLLKTNGIETLEQLKKCSLHRLRGQDRFGVKTIHEIETALSKYYPDNTD
jgi:hypothetical protein